MSNNRLLIAIAVIGVILVTVFSVEAELTRSSVTTNSAATFSTVRQPSGDSPLNGADPSDYIQQHQDSLSRNVVDLSDYYLRHPSSHGAPISAQAVDLSDYYLRHPSSHSAPISTKAVDLSDYFQRHPESLLPMNGPDVSDWFQRHPDWSAP